MRRSRLIKMSAALGVVMALGVGCAIKTVAPADVPPAASSAAGAVQRFAWGFNHKDLDVVRGLLTDDFVFISAGTDSAGNPSRVPNDRSWFLLALAALGDSTSRVSIVIDQTLVPFPDSRPGMDPKWHRQVRTSTRVVISSSGGAVDLVGNALFFVTRGDSAAIPPDLRARGVVPDSTRWWLNRFEDETLGGMFVAVPTARSLAFGPQLERSRSLAAH